MAFLSFRFLSDSSKESCSGTFHCFRLSLFGKNSTIILAIVPVVDLPVVHEDTPLIPTETPTIPPVISTLPYTSLFLYTDSSDSDTSKRPPSLDPYVVMLLCQRFLLVGTYRYPPNGMRKMLTARKSVGPLPSHRLALSSILDYSFDSPAASFASPSRKRRRSLAVSVPLATPVLGALSPVRADLLPPRKRIRDIDACIAAADAAAAREADDRVEVDTRIDREDEVEEEVESSHKGTVEIGVDTVVEPVCGITPSRVILFGDIPTVIPSTSMVAPKTSTISPVISSTVHVVETTLVASPTKLCGLVPYSGSDSDSPDEMSSPEYISLLPAISPFLCTDSSEAPDFFDGPPSQDPYVATVARWRSRERIWRGYYEVHQRRPFHIGRSQYLLLEEQRNAVQQGPKPSPAEDFQLDSGSPSTKNLIESLSNTLAILTQSYKSHHPQTNNQLRASSNARQSYGFKTESCGFKMFRGTVQCRLIKETISENNQEKWCSGKWAHSTKCPRPKRLQIIHNYFKTRCLLIQAQDSGAYWNEEPSLFLAGEQVTNVDDDVDIRTRE
ncbi:hypothetical protein Tco_0625325 [Tanacetum coccineum]|uniref:Uncharacterized protein n=1 Tax=Tanacetum coccineum TaxID=301880 RepID=A0ABQ4WGG2_9ASTR